jgi:hypothetical protein
LALSKPTRDEKKRIDRQNPPAALSKALVVVRKVAAGKIFQNFFSEEN